MRQRSAWGLVTLSNSIMCGRGAFHHGVYGYCHIVVDKEWGDGFRSTEQRQRVRRDTNCARELLRRDKALAEVHRMDHDELRELVLEIDAEGEDLTEWEIDFIASLIDNDVHQFTSKQAEYIRRIHKERIPE